MAVHYLRLPAVILCNTLRNCKPGILLRCVDDTFVFWSHGAARLQEILRHQKNPKPTIEITMAVETFTFFLSWMCLSRKWTQICPQGGHGNLLVQNVACV